jgi:hypothetical protein
VKRRTILATGKQARCWAAAVEAAAAARGRVRLENEAKGHEREII